MIVIVLCEQSGFLLCNQDLEDLQPILEKSAKETSEMMIRVEGEQKKANEKQKLVDADAAAVYLCLS